MSSSSTASSPISARRTLEPESVNVWGIWYAARFGKAERVRFILDHKKGVSSIDDQEQRMRWSALHFACRYGHVAVVQLLIKRGANPDLPDENGNTPLHLTAGWGNLRCCVLMLEAGANVSATNHSNQTPLSVATKLARKDHIQLLDRWRPIALGIKELDGQRAQTLSSTSEFGFEFLPALTKAAESEPNAAIRLELHALHSKLHSFGETHPGLLITFGKLGSLYRESNRLEKATEMTDRGLSLCESIHGETHLETAVWLNNAAELLLLQKRYEESCHFFRQAHTIFLELKGGGDHESLVMLENLAIAHHAAGDAAATIAYLQELLTLLHTRYHGGYNEKVFHLYMVLASTLLAQKRITEAKALFEDCLTHAETLSKETPADSDNPPASSLRIVRCTDAIGKCCFLLGDFQTAETFFDRSLRMLAPRQQGGALSSSRTMDAQVHLEAELQRAHKNVAMVAIAKKSASAVQRKLQHR